MNDDRKELRAAHDILVGSNRALTPEVIFKMIHKNPALFVECYEEVNRGNISQTTLDRIIGLVRDEQYVAAIKLFRDGTYTSLKEAKNFIDNVRLTLR